MASLSSRFTKVERKLASVVRTQRAQGAAVAGLTTRVSRLDSVRRALGLPAPRANPHAKHRVGKIQLDRAEGPTRDIGKRTARTFAEAQRILNAWSLTAPKAGKGYDKTDFVVVYDDGNLYDGRIDIQHPSVPDADNDLAAHMLYALRRHPNQKAAKAFLRDYQIGDAESRKNPARKKSAPHPEKKYGLWVKPESGKPYLSIGTENSYGPWDKAAAVFAAQDKLHSFERDDEFGYGKVDVVEVMQSGNTWVVVR